LDLVIAAQWYAIAVSLLAPLRSAKRVIAVQGAFPPALKGALYRLLVRALSGRADAVVAVSADLLGSMPEFARCKRRVVIPISVHVDRGPTNGRHPDMLYVGRLEPDKGVRDLVRLMYRSKQVALTIAGDGGLADEVQRAAHDLPHVSYLGWVDDPTELYRIHDYLVMPSHAEGCPHVLVEAIAHGAVPIVRDLPIARELGVPRPWRFGAIEEVPRIISDLRVASPPVVALQQARLRERVTARFSFPVVGAQWRELLSSVRPQ
jgi:glycosyltransferase involved in cell wall biosynthesis